MSSSLLHRLIRRALTRRYLLAAVAVVVVTVGAVASAGLQVRNDLTAFFVAGDPAVRDYETFKARFGTDELVLIEVDGAEDPFSPARVSELGALTADLQRIDGVARVVSLTTIDLVIEGPDGAAIVPARAAPDEARRQATGDGPLARLVDARGPAQRVWVWFTPAATTDAGRRATLAAIDDVVTPLRATRSIRVVGGGLVWEALNALTVRDGAVFISLAALVLFAGLVWLTRRLVWGVVAVVAVSCANTLVFAAMALTDTPMNAITVCLPSLVMALSVLDLVHLITTIDTLPDDVRTIDDDRVVSALARVLVPGLFNIVTTAVGLLALVTATSAVTRQLGAFAALGVVLAWSFCLVWTAVALPRALRHRRPHPATPATSTTSTTVTSRLAGLAVARPWHVLAGAGLVATFAAVGIMRLDVDTDTLGFLPTSHPVHRDVREVEARVGPFIPLEVELAFDADDAWQQARVMAGLARATRTLRGETVAGPRHEVRLGVPVSVLDVLEPAWRALGGAGEPMRDDDVVAAVAFVRVSAPQLLDGVVSGDGRHLRLTVPVTLTSASGFIAASRRVVAVVDHELTGTGARVTLTGYLPLYARIVEALVVDQVQSFLLAFVGIFVLIGLLLRSRQLLVLAAVPNLLPILGVLGVMGHAGIPLDVATITIAATILGVIVDDTVHTLFHLRRGLQEGLAVDDAIRTASRDAGRANVIGNSLLLAGFLVLTLASARSLVLVGGLSALAVALALVADLLVLPALAAVVLRSGPRPGSAP